MGGATVGLGASATVVVILCFAQVGDGTSDPYADPDWAKSGDLKQAIVQTTDPSEDRKDLSWSQLVHEYQAIFAAILGSVAGSVSTLLTVAWLKTRGKVTCCVTAFEIIPLTSDSMGGQKTTCLAEALRCEVRLALDLHNAKDVLSGLRDLRLCFLDAQKAETVSLRLHDQRTRRIVAGAQHADRLDVLNIPPHELLNLELSAFVAPEQIEAVRKSVTTRIAARSPDGKPLSWEVGCVHAAAVHDSG